MIHPRFSQLASSLALVVAAITALLSAQPVTSPVHAQEPAMCALSDEVILGQPFTYPGGSSGIILNEFKARELGIVESGAISAITGRIQAGADDVVLLIIDDFSTPVGQSLMSHGAYVRAVADQWKNELQGSTTFGAITVANVNVAAYDLSTLDDQIQDALDAAGIPRTGHPGRFVLNMSFAVLPCELGPVLREVKQFSEVAIADTRELFLDLSNSNLIVDYWANMTPLWRIERIEEDGVFSDLETGAVIQEFEVLTEAGTEPRALSRDELWGLLMRLNEVDTIRLSLQGGRSIDMSALDLYRAIRGDSLVMRLSFHIQPEGDAPLSERVEAHTKAAVGLAAALNHGAPRLAPIRFDALPSLAAAERIVVVAAAGNFDMIAPLAPGSWPEVISVSGSLSIPEIVISNDSSELRFKNKNTIRWSDSSTGELMAPGGWYAIEPGVMTPAGGGRHYVAGTSFAAPAVSVVMAATLTVGPVACCGIDLDQLGTKKIGDAFVGGVLK